MQARRIYIQDKGMEFGIEKCASLMRSGKRQIAEGIELPNEEIIRTLGEKENYDCMEILEADTIKQAEMKDKIRKSISNKQETSRNQALQ